MSDDLDLIHAALERDGYYVDPSLSSRFSADQLASLQAALATTDQATYVVAYPFRDNDAYAGKGADLVTRLHDRYPEAGVYLTTTTNLTPTEYSSIRLEGRQYDVAGQANGDLDDYLVLSTVYYENPPDLGSAFVRAVELLNAEPEAVTKAYDKAQAAADVAAGRSTSTGTGGDSGDESGGGGTGGGGFDPTALIVAVLALGVVAALARTGIRQLGGRLRAASRRTPVVLPAATLARIRESQERKREAEAHDAVQALGVAVDEISINTASKRAGWQAAFDHFEAARDLLESTTGATSPGESPSKSPGGSPGESSGTSPSDPLDVVGVLVLVARGEEALSAARRGRTWTPSTPCFLNPLHGVALERIRLDGGPRGQDVPACVACRSRLGAGSVPDMLDVEHRGRTVHYFETDVEPWAATGYGALDTDLLGALGRARG